MMKNSLLLRLFSSPRAWFSRDAGEPVWFPHVPMVLARMLAQSEESHGQELVNQLRFLRPHVPSGAQSLGSLASRGDLR